MNPRLIIGAPVYKRAWILPLWFDRIEKQSFPLEQMGFIFEGSPDDEETHDVLFSWQSQHPEISLFEVNINDRVKHQEHFNGVRRWTRDRYHEMAQMRNNLLDRVRIRQPERYLSLDTDILLDDPETIDKLWVLTEEECDAASPLMFMIPRGNAAPSTMTWADSHSRKAVRRDYPLGTNFITDVIMAAKMMTPRVYNEVNYEYHRQGEDLGWSSNCKDANLKLMCASTIYAPHIMSETILQDYLINGDIRKDIISNKKAVNSV